MIRRVLWVCLPLLLLGCSANPRSFFGGDIEVEIVTEAQINQDSPVAVELIVVRNEQLLEKLLATPAKDWFETQREQARRDYPGDKSFASWYWELVPGQPVLTQKLEFDSGVRAVVVFAHYFSPGAHRVRAEPHLDLVIRLGKDDVTVEPKS